MSTNLFDGWADKYDGWFTTPVGKRVKEYESRLLLEMLNPQPGELILDVGCGTGIFTSEIIRCGAKVVGVELSFPMLEIAARRQVGTRFSPLQGDMLALPFHDDCFDKVCSMTAIEFVADAESAVAELHRVTRAGGTAVLTTLNSLSPWAAQRRRKAKEGHDLFQQIHFRSPEEIQGLVPEECTVRTAIHFHKNDPVDRLAEIEQIGATNSPHTGAFLAARWRK